MKKAISLLLALVMCLSLCACGSKKENITPGDNGNSTTTQTDNNTMQSDNNTPQSAYVGEWKANVLVGNSGDGREYDVAIILVAHPKKTNNAFDNDTVSGSADITNAVSFVFNYQRADEADNCDSLLMVTKNRMNGKILTGDNAIKLYYSQKSKRVVSDPSATKEYGCFRDSGYVHHSWIDDLEPL